MYKPHSPAVVLVCLCLAICLLIACRREPNLVPASPSQQDTTQLSSDSTLQPHDTIVQPIDTSSYTVDNSWECEIDGILYSGTVDTSFITFTHSYQTHPDTLIACSGTAGDKKANIRFEILMNRYYYPEGSYTNYGSLFLFDTVSNNYITSVGSSMAERIHYTVDTLLSNKLKASFSGIALNGTVRHVDYSPAIAVSHTISRSFQLYLW